MRRQVIKSDQLNQQFRSRCYKCYRPSKACFCDHIEPFATHFEFRILMHPKEAKCGHVGTGRIANHALKNCSIIIDENFDSCEQVQKLIHSTTYFPMLLYPGCDSINISKEKIDEKLFEGKIPLIFIIDGTWHCAKSMMRDSKTLHNLPRLSFSTDIKSKFDIRQQPDDFCLSTIESIYQVLYNLEEQGFEKLADKKENLLLALTLMVDFQIKCASDPSLKSYRHSNGRYSKPSDRKKNIHVNSRKICFEEINYYRVPRN